MALAGVEPRAAARERGDELERVLGRDERVAHPVPDVHLAGHRARSKPHGREVTRWSSTRPATPPAVASRNASTATVLVAPSARWLRSAGGAPIVIARSSSARVALDEPHDRVAGRAVRPRRGGDRAQRHAHPQRQARARRPARTAATATRRPRRRSAGRAARCAHATAYGPPADTPSTAKRSRPSSSASRSRSAAKSSSVRPGLGAGAAEAGPLRQDQPDAEVVDRGADVRVARERRSDRAVQVDDGRPVGRPDLRERQEPSIGELDGRPEAVCKGHGAPLRETTKDPANRNVSAVGGGGCCQDVTARQHPLQRGGERLGALHHRDVAGARDPLERHVPSRQRRRRDDAVALAPQHADRDGQRPSSGRRSAAATLDSASAMRVAPRDAASIARTSAGGIETGSAVPGDISSRRPQAMSASARAAPAHAGSPAPPSPPNARAARGDMARSPAGATSTSRRRPRARGRRASARRPRPSSARRGRTAAARRARRARGSATSSRSNPGRPAATAPNPGTSSATSRRDAQQRHHPPPDHPRRRQPVDEHERLASPVASCASIQAKGADQNRTGVHGFAGRCVATPPRRRVGE